MPLPTSPKGGSHQGTALAYLIVTTKCCNNVFRRVEIDNMNW